MFSTDDTIVAIATPPGHGGIGVVRISGPAAYDVGRALTGRASFQPRHATLATISDAQGARLDSGLVTFFPAPHSYTAEDVVEVSLHGTPVVLEGVVAAAMRAGARLANPGDFTFRAYIHGRMDLVQAEAVAELVAAVTPVQARAACDLLNGTLTDRIRAIDAPVMDLIARLEASLDFSEEGYHFVDPGEAARAAADAIERIDALLVDARRGRLIREGFTVAIVGRPNVGKSSLFNRLAGAARAIVTDVPGTTRDLLTERVDVDGIPLTIVDTAGLRAFVTDAIEEEGISRARAATAAADVVLVVLDGSMPLSDEDDAILNGTAGRRRVIAASKSDLPAVWDLDGCLRVSALTDDGLGALRAAILEAMAIAPLRDGAAVANLRHVSHLERARASLVAAQDAASAGRPEEFVVADLHEARAAFDEITGARTTEDVLRLIFERFCIGK
jgi:tRNA modification GTPase